MARHRHWTQDVVTRRVFDYDHRLLPNRFLEELERETPDIETAVRVSGLSIGYPAWNLLYYSFLCALPSDRSAVHVLETGTNNGFSTIILAQVLKDSKIGGVVHTVDLEPEATNSAQIHVRKAGLSDHVRFYVDNSHEFLKWYTKQVDWIDFAFLDSDHRADHLIEEFVLIHPKLIAANSTV